MGEGERFPPTRHSVVAALAATDSRLAEPAWDALVRGYWRPVYAYLSARTYGTTVDPMEMITGFALAALLTVAATIIPIRFALRRLESIERG